MSDFWSSVRKRCAARDRFHRGPDPARDLLLAVPMISRWPWSLFAIVDIFWSRGSAPGGRQRRSDRAMLTLIYTVAMGLSIGRRRRWHGASAKRSERAARSAVQVLVLGITLAIPSALPVPPRSATAWSDGRVGRGHRGGQGYTAMMLGGNATVLLLFLGNAIFRGGRCHCDASVVAREWLHPVGSCFISG
jgi:hypothetical protein